MSEIRIDYTQVIRQAGTMKDLSDDLDREIRALENTLEQIRLHWLGPAATEFKKHLRVLIADLKVTKNNMSRVSSTINNVAVRYKQEEERQAELAKQLTE